MRAREMVLTVAMLLVVELSTPTVAYRGTVKPRPGSAVPTLLFAGHMFVTDASDIETVFPSLSRAIRTLERQGRPLSRLLTSRVQSAKPVSFEIESQQLGDSLAKSPLVLGLAFDHETVSVERFTDTTKVLVELSAQALVFDYKNQVVVAAYPVVIQRVDVRDRAPSEVDVESIVQSLLTDNGGHSVVDEFVRTFESVDLRPTPNFRIGTRAVVFADAALAMVSPGLKARPGLVERSLANTLAQYMSVHQRIAMVPYSRGQAVAGQMALRYANGDVFILKLPVADYAFDLEVLDFRRAAVKSTVAATSYAYGVFARIRLVEPLSGRAYLDVVLKHAGTKTVPIRQESVDDWAAYQEVLTDFIDEFTKRLSSEELNKWMKDRVMPKGTSVATAEVRRLVEICR